MNNKKYTLEEAIKIFSDGGCKLLESIYINVSTPMKYRCECGNISKIPLRKFEKGQRCRKCGYLKMANKQKFTLEEVKNIFKENGCELLESIYKNCFTTMKYKCECGNRSSINLHNFKNGQRCKKCGLQKAINKQRFTLEEVKEIFKDNGCELLETKYINSLSLLRYKCECGNISKISLNNLRTGQKCLKCGRQKTIDKQRFELEEVRNIFKNNGCELLETKYINASSKMRYRCICGHVSKIRLDSFKNRGSRCRQCYLKKTGPNHHNYKPLKTDEEREKGRNLQSKEYKEWRSAVFKRDNFTCQRCKELKDKAGKYKRVNAHHMDSWNKFPTKRYDIDNGITYCEDCHKDFHNIYGRGNNLFVQSLIFSDQDFKKSLETIAFAFTID